MLTATPQVQKIRRVRPSTTRTLVAFPEQRTLSSNACWHGLLGLLQDRAEALKSRVDHIARQRLSSDPKLISMPNDAIQRELLGEIDRFACSS